MSIKNNKGKERKKLSMRDTEEEVKPPYPICNVLKLGKADKNINEREKEKLNRKS